MSELFTPADVFDRRLALDVGGPLGELNAAGVLTAADVHVARTLGRLCGESGTAALTAAALTVRATRTGSVCLDLADVARAFPEHSWPEPPRWRDLLAGSALVAHEVLRLEGSLVYLDRYWQAEGSVVADLGTRASLPSPAVDEERLAAGLRDLFPAERYAEQRAAAEASVRRRTSVITGGPGTGKTTTLARLLALLAHVADRPPRFALAAPTGKAAARMSQAIAGAVADDSFPAAHRAGLDGLTASTLHRLLGFRPDNSTRFRHHRGNRLVADVVVVDETSMVSLTMMARLLEAVRPEALLVLVGDPDQLASVEAGAVLRNLVDGLRDAPGTPVSQLRRVHRFGRRIGALAAAVREGEEDLALQVLAEPDAGVAAVVHAGWLPADPATGEDLLDRVEWLAADDHARLREIVEPHAASLVAAASGGDDAAALAALGAHRLLCAHREGPYGAAHWNRQVERWLMERAGRDWLETWYAGQPLLVDSNDYALRLWNGDTGVVTVARPGEVPRALFDDGTETGRSVPLSRLGEVRTAHAMTVHRAQGSQFREVTVLLPPADSPLATRELLYTALTRASDVVRVVGDEAAVRAAVRQQVRRATGLEQRLRRA